MSVMSSSGHKEFAVEQRSIAASSAILAELQNLLALVSSAISEEGDVIKSKIAEIEFAISGAHKVRSDSSRSRYIEIVTQKLYAIAVQVFKKPGGHQLQSFQQQSLVLRALNLSKLARQVKFWAARSFWAYRSNSSYDFICQGLQMKARYADGDDNPSI